MARLLLAVLVPGTATPDTIDTHLAAPLRPLIRAKVITGYRLDRPSATDTPTNHHHNSHRRHSVTAPTPNQYRRWLPTRRRLGADTAPGTAPAGDPGHRIIRPGDLVALPALLAAHWQFPARATPHAWVDLAGVVWLVARH